MKRKHFILELFNGVEDRFVVEAIQGREQARPVLRRKRIVLLAAVIALATLLVGCGIVYALHMQDLQITDREGENPYISTEGTVTQRIIAIGGPQGTSNYQAAKDWYDFETPYLRSHARDRDFPCPPEYALYQPYSQEMVEHLAQILETYDLKPAGPLVHSESAGGLLDYLGIRQVLLPDAPAQMTGLSARYHESGLFSVFGRLRLDPGKDPWPHETPVEVTFSPKAYFNSEVIVLDEPENWKEWNYTTAAGDTFLLLYNPNYFEAYAICDQGDRMISISIQTTAQLYDSYRFSDEIMSEKQMEQFLEVFDFSLRPQPGDEKLLSGLSAGYDPAQRRQTQNGITVELKEAVSDGHLAWVTLGITLPEDTAQVRRNDMGLPFWNLQFRGTDIRCQGEERSFGHSFRNQDDGDGLDNTLECVITWTGEETLPAGSQWTLELEGMSQAFEQTAWESYDLWKFDFTFDDSSDSRALEFLAGAAEIPAITGVSADGQDQWGTMTVTAITLRSNSLSLRIEEPLGYGDLSANLDGETKDPMIVLQDGSTIALLGYGGTALDESNTACVETLRPETPVPLDAVDHLLLIDGTKLYPQG